MDHQIILSTMTMPYLKAREPLLGAAKSKLLG